MRPWYMAVSDARSICMAHLQPFVCVGVGGRIMVGVSVWRMGIEDLVVSDAYHVLSILLIFVIVWGMWSWSPS